MNTIERILQEKSLDSEQSILMGQWEFDKKNIPNALKAVAIVFPHFSLHDETHSLTILNNIVKMLGESVIRQLSCTDLWLLLESAYSHDLGMVVTSKRLEDALKGDDFFKHYMKIAADNNHPCNIYTRFFVLKDGKLLFKEEELNANILDAIRFLLADFFRTKHGENSKKVVSLPMDEVGVDSPRSNIPSRLFGMLSDICQAHTRGFDAVMSLPKNEDGIGLDECHPRFIACMLRLGDLLDIDNSRFSESLMKTIKALPSDSQAHFDKHKAISHLSINTKCIEIEAVCHSPKVAQVTQEWFDWISNEFMTQTLKWNSIVPDGLVCYLPTLNYLRTKIEGYETVNGNSKPKFTIDTSKALELLQGKNFYTDPFDSLREIIQNAVDSTLIRIYQDATIKEKQFDQLNQDFLDFAKQYPITVSLIEQEDKYVVEVKDQGTGLKQNQLTYLINTGSSSKNVEKKRIIDDMPDWMRPSGVFGIGFQSIFLLTDKVEIQTKDCYSDEKMWIEMYSPNSAMKGDVFLKKVKGVIDVGMTVRFEIKESMKAKTVEDPFNGLPKDIKINLIENKIRLYASKSVVPIKIRHIVNESSQTETVERQKFTYYDNQTGIELYFSEKTFDFSYLGGPSFYYRNAKVNGGGAGFMFLSPIVNLHYGNAKDILTLDRDKFKDGKAISEKTKDAVVNFINSDAYNSLLNSLKDETKNNALFKFSFFVEYYNKNKDIKDANKLVDVKSFVFDLGIERTMGVILSTDKVKFRTCSNQIFQIAEEEGILTIEANLISIATPNVISEIAKLLFKMLTDSHKHCYCTNRLVNNFFVGAEVLFTNDDNIPEVRVSLNDFIREIERSSVRSYLHFIPGYEELKLSSDEVMADIKELYLINIIDNIKFEKIISPFIKINGKLYDCRTEELYNYVSERNGNTIEAVKSAYERFVAAVKEIGVEVHVVEE